MEQQPEDCEGKTGRIGNEDPEPTETIEVNEDREDAKELEHNGRNQIVAAEIMESQSVSDDRSTETELLAREQPPRTGINEADSTRELLVLWMKYVYYTRTQAIVYPS